MDVQGIVNQDLVDQAVEETKSTSGTNDGGDFDPNMFLKILMSQLQNQSPFDAVDTKEIVQQQAILTQVEQATRQTGLLEETRGDMQTGFLMLQQGLADIKGLLGG
jgi:flagellar hook assembly protein FlgD